LIICFVKTNTEVLQAASVACTRFVEATSRGMEQVFDPARVGVLRLAVERGPIRPTELARELGVNPSSITRQAQALHALGHVTVSADPNDGRAFLVEATKRGRAELRSFDAVGLEVFAAVVEEWSEEELLLLTNLLDRMVETWAGTAEDKRRTAHERAGVAGSTAPWWAGS
jgi:DNA-binding MarR family transcriptional regulator